VSDMGQISRNFSSIKEALYLRIDHTLFDGIRAQGLSVARAGVIWIEV
jgi:hypothetical protein